MHGNRAPDLLTSICAVLRDPLSPNSRREVAPPVDIRYVQFDPGLGTAPAGDTPERAVAEGEADLAEPPARLLPPPYRPQQSG